jgi:hypothetical protein
MTQRTSFIPQQQLQQNTGPVDPRNPQAQQPKPVDPEKLFIDEMRTRIDAYFAIVLRNIRDTIPKIIGNFLVRAVQEKLQYTLYNEINKNETIMDTVGEPPHIVAERETLNKVLGVLRKARLVLTKDPDLAPTFKDTMPSQPLKVASQQKTSETKPTQSYQSEPERQPSGQVFPSRPEPEKTFQPSNPMNNPQQSTMRTNQPMTGGQQPMNTGGQQRQNDPFNQPSNNPFAPTGGSKVQPTGGKPGLFGGPAPDNRKPPTGGAGLFG